MNRKLIFYSALAFAILAVCFGVSHYANSPTTLPPITPGDFAVKSPATEQPAVQSTPSKHIRLAVGGLGFSNDVQNRTLGDLIDTAMSSAPGFELVERQELNAVLREAELNVSGLVRAQDAVRVGKLLKADWFLLGTISAAGTNRAIIARLVESRTGIMRDVGVFPFHDIGPDLASALAEFVRRSRDNPGNEKPREYLAIGTFRDLSVNNRLAHLPEELRSRLVEEFRNSPVTLLEREYVETLRNEINLDLAGLTDTPQGNSLAAMPSAFWLVEGYYQSYENSRLEVELELQVRGAYGPSTNVLIREAAGEPLFQKVKNEVSLAMQNKAILFVPTRSREASFQMEAGRELAGMLFPAFLVGNYGFADFQSDSQEQAIRVRNLDEAIKAYQTVLLLEPGNRQAKMGLAWCFINPLISEADEAREIYREILEEKTNDQWTSQAQLCIQYSFQDGSASGAEKAKWYGKALAASTNRDAAEFFSREANIAKRDLTITSGDTGSAKSLAEQRLIDELKLFDAGRRYSRDMGLNDFTNAYGADHAGALQALNRILPKLKEAASNTVPYLLASLVAVQDDTNAPVIGEFKLEMSRQVAHPHRAQVSTTFWNHIRWTAHEWAVDHKAYNFAADIMSAKINANIQNQKKESYSDSERDEDNMTLAYDYLSGQSWPQALKIFEGWSNEPVSMGNSGLWGEAFSVVQTSERANYCRRKMGVPEIHDPREFTMEWSKVCFCGDFRPELEEHSSGTFAAGDGGLWFADRGILTSVSYGLRTNFLVPLGVAPDVAITQICMGASNLWIGTGGGGLIEFDKSSHRLRRLTDADGLLMSYISSLELSGNTLWIGYGNVNGGGLGRINLQTHEITSFTPSLAAHLRAAVPKSAVTSLATAPDGELWLYAYNGGIIRHGTKETDWQPEGGFPGAGTLASDFRNLYHGNTLNYEKGKDLGVRIRSFDTGNVTNIPPVKGLPNQQVTVLKPAEGDLWIGGMGYIAVLDLSRNEIRKLAYVKGRNVQKIQLGGGYIWALVGPGLLRAPIP
ncbi:MAG TPA: CsgG/HfaB family protein [Verrucomicrobiae bacterium]|jgi:hypothetical protein|nr:CsgG/HfaB family protein [Verrucomicrobiae bacterium]